MVSKSKKRSYKEVTDEEQQRKEEEQKIVENFKKKCKIVNDTPLKAMVKQFIQSQASKLKIEEAPVS